MRSRSIEFTVVVAIVVLLATQLDAFGARYTPIEIRLNGILLLKGAGHSEENDSDQLWNDLTNVRFDATPEFTEKYVKQGARQVVLECTDKAAKQTDLLIWHSVSGEARPRTLRIYRVKPDQVGREWMLDYNEVKQLFYNRTMIREDVVKVKSPGRDGPKKPADGKKRNVAVAVSWNDVLLLEGSDDDDGRRDADALWDNVPNVRLRASEAFLAEYVNDTTTTVTVVGTLNVNHGGTSTVALFRVVRVKPDELGREWMLDAKSVDDQFALRKITRDQASYLKKPKRSR